MPFLIETSILNSEPLIEKPALAAFLVGFFSNKNLVK